MSLLEMTKGLIDFDQKNLAMAAFSIAFNPLFWNIAARQEYYHKTLTRLFNGNSLLACYALGGTIFLLGLLRDAIFERALRSQPTYPAFQTPQITLLAYTFLIFGNVLVGSSMWALGITGTYLGDYFGILKDAKVTGFPFNIVGAPMYVGSTMSFFGTSLLFAKPAGFLLTLEVGICYIVACGFEDPFTERIYAGREVKRD